MSNEKQDSFPALVSGILARFDLNRFCCSQCGAGTKALDVQEGASGQLILKIVQDWVCECGGSEARRGSGGLYALVNVLPEQQRLITINPKTGEMSAIPWLDEAQQERFVKWLTEPVGLLEDVKEAPLSVSGTIRFDKKKINE